MPVGEPAIAVLHGHIERVEQPPAITGRVIAQYPAQIGVATTVVVTDESTACYIEGVVRSHSRRAVHTVASRGRGRHRAPGIACDVVPEQLGCSGWAVPP